MMAVQRDRILLDNQLAPGALLRQINLPNTGGTINTRRGQPLASPHSRQNPLIMAAKSGSISGVEFLLTKGAQTDLKNKDGQTALKHARALHKNEEIYNADLVEARMVSLLLKAKAKE